MVRPPKKFVFIFNLIISLLGVALIGLGSYVHVDTKDYIKFLSGSYLNTPILIIVIGVLILPTVVLGCYAATKDCKMLMVTYIFLLFALIVSQIGAGIAAFALKGELGGSIERNMKEAMNHYGVASQEADTVTWDRVQTTFHCCGVFGWKDWKNATSPGLPRNTVPDSCCIEVRVVHLDVEVRSEELQRQLSYAIKNQLGHPKPPTRGFGTQRPNGSLLAPRWFFMA